MAPEDIYCFLFHHHTLSRHSGMGPLVEAMGARAVYYDIFWEQVRRRSWRLSCWAKTWGAWYYGTKWNALWPGWGERALARALPANRPSIAHLVFADFTLPRRPAEFKKRQARLVGTFHASARRLPGMFSPRALLEALDLVTLVSETQRPFFLERGVEPSRLKVILHGVVTSFFKPAPCRERSDGALRGLLVGKTERDHAFAASVMRALPEGTMTLSVATSPDQQEHYRDTPHVERLPRLDDNELLEAYQQADLLFMPVFDCTANNSVLEAMSCGTPVLANAVGGMPEYVGREGGMLLEDKNVERWVEALVELSNNRQALEARRASVRRWAEGFDWTHAAQRHLEAFSQCMDVDA